MSPEDNILWTRVFEKFDIIDTRLTDLCNRAVKTETALNSHLTDQEKRANRKEKVFYIVIAAISAGFGLFEVFK